MTKKKRPKKPKPKPETEATTALATIDSHGDLVEPPSEGMEDAGTEPEAPSWGGSGEDPFATDPIAGDGDGREVQKDLFGNDKVLNPRVPPEASKVDATVEAVLARAERLQAARARLRRVIEADDLERLDESMVAVQGNLVHLKLELGASEKAFMSYCKAKVQGIDDGD